jgi:hypothetical protein
MQFKTFSFSASIFKILADSQNNFLAIEIRNSELKEVSFAVIDLQTQTLQLEETGFEEDWRVGLSAIEQGKLVLHTYTDSRLPDKKGIYAIDIVQQSVAWEQSLWNFEKFYLQTQNNSQNNKENILLGAFCYENGEKKTCLFNLENGEIAKTNENKNSENIKLLVIANFAETYFYSPESEHFNTILAFIKPHFDKNVIWLGFDYIETEKSFFMLCYYKNPTFADTIKLENHSQPNLQIYLHLFSFDSKGNKLIAELIATNLGTKEIGNRIFLFGNQLVILQSDKSLVIVS